jgi:gentisate 1,2-dioxygenase
MPSTRMLTPLRVSKRVNKFNGSFYESDQEDNVKDCDYNPNEYLQSNYHSSEVKPFTRRNSPRSSQMKQYHYEDASDREYEFEEDDEEYFPEEYVPRQTSKSSLTTLKKDSRHTMRTRSSQRKF